MKTRSIDMLHGGLLRKLIIFSMPIAASSILQQLFNSADTAVVGRFGNPQALAAVGTNGEVISLFVCLITGLAVGVNVLIARYIGMGVRGKISGAVHTSIAMALICGFGLLIAGQFLAEPLLRFIATPEDVMEPAVLYLRLYFLGSPFIMLYNFAGSILRAKGDSQRPLNALLISGVLNVLLNLFFVIVCRMGVAGVALATDFSNVVSAAILMKWLREEPDELQFRWKGLLFDKEHVLRILAIGGPAGIQGAVFCFSNLFIQAAINSFGSNAVAGAAAALNFEYFAYYMITAFAQTATTFVSQNFAAGKEDRCRKIFWECLVLGGVFCAILSVPCTIWRRVLLRLYSTDPGVIEFGVVRVMHVLILQPLCIFYEIPAGCLRGRGHSIRPAVETILGTVVFRLLWLVTVFAHYQSFGSIFLVYPVSWIFTGTMVCISYFLVLRKQNRKIQIS